MKYLNFWKRNSDGPSLKSKYYLSFFVYNTSVR